jgi:hypothetical protein
MPHREIDVVLPRKAETALDIGRREKLAFRRHFATRSETG